MDTKDEHSELLFPPYLLAYIYEKGKILFTLVTAFCPFIVLSRT